ncbi:MAG: hypothetical protein AAGJ94_03000 [Pseudomonadota bacterium]
MTSRDQFVETLKSQIDEWNTQIGDLEAKMKKASDDMEATYAQQIAEASRFRADAQAKLAETLQTSHDMWDKYRDGTEAAVKDITEGFKKAWDRFS